jgi:FKBP-type peptidyl-prolyl cis-trans isomerase FklB
MKYTKQLTISALLPVLFVSTPAFAANDKPTSELDKISYSLGVKTAENFNAQQIKINPQQFMHGMNDILNKQKTALSSGEMQDILVKFQKDQLAIMSKREKQIAAENLTKSNAFLEANKKQPGVKTLPSGLQYIEITSGKGTPPLVTDTVQVNYRGTLIDGTEFDSSYGRKEPSIFPIENLIPGWQEALTHMKPGAKWKIFVPPQLGYGAQGAGNVIEPNSALIFEIELVDVKKTKG